MSNLKHLACTALLTFLSTAAFSQSTYPSKPVKVIVPLGAGGAPDVIMRHVAQVLTEKNGQPFLVENRPGANTIIGTDACAKSVPDGSTLCVVTGSSLSINPSVYRKLPYDASRDFEAIALLAVPDMVLLAAPTLAASSFKDMIAQAKASPGKLAYGSFGIGSDTHLTMEWIKRETGISLLHVPFNGFGPIMQAMNTGDIQLIFVSLGNPGILPQVKSGKLKALALMSPSRNPQVPDVPTFSEVGLGNLKGFTWFGLIGPAGLPKDVIRKLNEQVSGALQSTAVREQLAGMAMRVRDQSPDEFKAFLQQDREVWKAITKEANVVLD